MRKIFSILIICLFIILMFVSCSKSQQKTFEEKQLTDVPATTVTSSQTSSLSHIVTSGSLSKVNIESIKNINDNYVGKWFSSQSAKDYDSTWTEGGYILEINEIKDNYIKGYYSAIQSPPANRIADFYFEAYIDNNKLNFEFEDSFFNTGNATIEFKDTTISVKINTLEISEDNSSGWCVSDATFIINDKK